MARDFATAWAQQGGHTFPVKRTANGYETSSPVSVYNPYAARSAYFGRPVKYASPTQVIPSLQRRREITAHNNWHESASRAFYRCLSDLERFAQHSRCGG